MGKDKKPKPQQESKKKRVSKVVKAPKGSEGKVKMKGPPKEKVPKKDDIGNYKDDPWPAQITTEFDVLGSAKGQLVQQMTQYAEQAGSELSPALLSVGFILGGLAKLDACATTHVAPGGLKKAQEYCEHVLGLGTADGIETITVPDTHDIALSFDLPTASLLATLGPSLIDYNKFRDVSPFEQEIVSVLSPMHVVRKVFYEVRGFRKTKTGDETAEPVLGNLTFVIENRVFEGKDAGGSELWASRKTYLVSVPDNRVGPIP